MKLLEIPINQIRTKKYRIREEHSEAMKPEKMDKLKNNILLNKGLATPIKIIKEGEFYEVIGGYRRFHACRALRHEKIWALVLEDKCEAECRIEAILDNQLRENMNSGDYIDSVRELVFHSIIFNDNKENNFIDRLEKELEIKIEMLKEGEGEKYLDRLLKFVIGLPNSTTDKLGIFVRNVFDRIAIIIENFRCNDLLPFLNVSQNTESGAREISRSQMRKQSTEINKAKKQSTRAPRGLSTKTRGKSLEEIEETRPLNPAVNEEEIKNVPGNLIKKFDQDKDERKDMQILLHDCYETIVARVLRIQGIISMPQNYRCETMLRAIPDFIKEFEDIKDGIDEIVKRLNEFDPNAVKWEIE